MNAGLVGAVAALAVTIVGGARPNRYGHSDREERHLMPAVSSGPHAPGPGAGISLPPRKR